MDNHRKPPIMNIEVQSIDEEINVCNNIYQFLLQTLCELKRLQFGVSPVEYKKARKDVAKRAQWWKRQMGRQVFLRFLRDNGIDYYSGRDYDKYQDVIYENEFYQKRALEEMKSE